MLKPHSCIVQASDERDAVSPEIGKLARRIPKQVDAPIITGIVDHRLVRVPGHPIEQTAPVAGMSQYLLGQFGLVISDIESRQASIRMITDFRQGEALLHNWSSSNIIAFGFHLYLLESHVNDLKQELLEDAARRLDALIHSSQGFVNSFEEWRKYLEQSSLLDVDSSENRKEIISVAHDAAKSFARERESVDPQITSALTEYANAASSKEAKQSVAVGLVSTLRSITNISISFTEYVLKAAKESYASIVEGGRAMKLLKTICQFFPLVMRLAANHPDFSWLLNYSNIIRTACENLGKLKLVG